MSPRLACVSVVFGYVTKRQRCLDPGATLRQAQCSLSLKNLYIAREGWKGKEVKQVQAASAPAAAKGRETVKTVETVKGAKREQGSFNRLTR